jgi:hypothetical protein
VSPPRSVEVEEPATRLPARPPGCSTMPIANSLGLSFLPTLLKSNLVDPLATALDKKKQHHNKQHARNYPDDNRIVHYSLPLVSG